MIDFRNDINTLFEAAFGVKMPVFIPYPLEVNRQELPSFKQSVNGVAALPIYTDVKDSGVDLSSRKSHFGLPVYSPIKFVGGTYKKFDKYGKLIDAPMQDFSLPATTLVDISRSKILTETAQNAGEGAIIEMYGFESWTIRMRMLCLKDRAHPTHQTAQLQKEAIMEWENLASGIDVFGDVFSEKDIFHIVIKSVNVSQLEGRPNAIPIEIQAIGITAPELVTI